MRWPKWLVLIGLLTGVVALTLVEPMRWRLPIRYLFKPFDIHRTGFIDFALCMRVELSPAEAREFVENAFEARARTSKFVNMSETQCPAAFWPRGFANPTSGYSVDYGPNGSLGGATGAVYENGYLYFWANTM